ncbi:MAG: hypothetical protein JW819_06935, partial [Candidatus Krumholzibacteriota bacterium]|nr:hypothetical protein [Candidatus Krumholzibacteriota bacterium]
DIPSIVAAEFRVDNLPVEQCYITEDWASPLYLGNLDWGFSIAFMEPQAWPIVYLGTVRFLAYEDVGPDYAMHVAETNDSGNLVVVDAELNTIPVSGGWHWFNCSVPEDCMCVPNCGLPREDYIGLFSDLGATYCYQDLPLVTPAAGASWGGVKSLY